MAYPTVPDLVPFEPDMRPNLLLIGLYDQQLTAIEDYLKKLGAYVDAQDAKLAERITALEGEVADLKRRMSAAEATIADHTERIEAIEPYIEALKTPVNVAVPARISDSGDTTEKQNVAVLSFTGDGPVTMSSPALEAIDRLIANLMLAAPNGDHESVLGHLAGNTETLTTAAESVRSSAALTAAYESPALPTQNPDGDAIVTAGEISHVSDTAGTDGPGLFKTSDGWVYVGTPTS